METGRFARHRRLHGAPAGEWVSAPVAATKPSELASAVEQRVSLLPQVPTDLSARFRSPQRSNPRLGYGFVHPQSAPAAAARHDDREGVGAGLTPTLQVGVALND